MLTIHERELRKQLILNLQNNLLDADCGVDEVRRDLDVALERLRWAVARRDDLAHQLEHVIAEHTAAA